MIPEKTVGKLRQGWGSICFLLAPWWKYGKTLMVGSFISSVLFVPAAGYFSATLAQAVIEMIEAGKPFEAAFLTGLTYLLLALALNLLHAVYEDFYLRWKKQEIEGTIERSIYEKALMVDYRHFDDPSYFDSYKLTTEKFASQSSETLQNLFSLLSGVAKCIVYGALIASQGVALLLIVLGCSAFVAYAQIYWSRVSVERETAMLNDQRKADYLRRLFFDHTAVADLRASNIKKPLFSLFDGSLKSRAAIYRKYGAKEFLTDILVNLAQLGTTFAVPVYVAWGVMSGNIGGVVQAEQDLCERRLPRAIFADDGDLFSGRDGKTQITDGKLIAAAVAVGHMVESDGKRAVRRFFAVCRRFDGRICVEKVLHLLRVGNA